MLSTVFTYTALLLATASASPVLIASRGVSTTGWTYKGCFTEATDRRALIGKTYFNDFMTEEKCAAACSSYTYFGLEYGRECYCSNDGLNTGSVAAPEQECNTACPGNASQLCGAGNRLNVYTKDATYTPTPTGTSPVPTPSSYTQIGCYTDDNLEQRALSEANYYDDNLTVEKCADLCGSEFKYYGLEYARECWCGNTLRRSVSVPIEECSFPCAGNPGQKCGASYRLSLYALTSSLPVSSSTTTSSSTTLLTTLSPSPSPTTTTTTTSFSTTTSTTTTTTTTLAPEPTNCLASPVVNGGFELVTGTGQNAANNWLLANAQQNGIIGPVSTSVTSPHGGSSSYMMQAPIKSTSNFHNLQQTFEQGKGLCVGRTYNFSVWVKVQHANLATPVTFEVGNVGYNYPEYATPPMTPIASTQWYNFRGSFPVLNEQSARRVFLSLRFPPLTSTFAVYWDDIVLTMAPI